MMAKAGMKRPDENISTESNTKQHKQRNDKSIYEDTKEYSELK